MILGAVHGAVLVPMEVIASRQQRVLGGASCQTAPLSIRLHQMVDDREAEEEEEAADS